MTVLRYHRSGHASTAVQQILESLERGKSIHELSLEETFDDDSVQQLCHLFLQRPAAINVTSLSLVRNELTEVAAEALGKLLYSNQTIQHLDLSHNLVGDRGAQLIAAPLLASNTTLTSLNLTDNGCKTANALASVLRRTQPFTSLQLGHNPLGPKGIKLLAAEVSRLERLSLPHTKLGPRGIRLIITTLEQSPNHSLTFLDVTSNNIGVQGARALTSCLLFDKTLQTLWLGSNDLGPDGATALASCLSFNSTLRELQLGDNQVGDVGATALAQGLLHNSSLHVLRLDWNNIGNDGGKALGNALMTNSCLSELDLQANQIGTEGAVALAEALPYNYSLRLLHLKNNRMTDAAASAFHRALVVGCGGVFQTLTYDENDMTHTGIQQLEHAFRYRKNYRNWFGDVRQKLDRNQIVSLDLWSKKMGDEEVMELASVLKERRPSSLQTLFIGGDHVTSKGITFFASEFLERPEACGQLLRFYVRGSSMGNSGAVAIAKAVENALCPITVLSLTSSGITVTGAKALANSIRKNKCLRRMNLNHNSIGDAGLMAFAEALKHQQDCDGPYLKSLSVAGNGITDIGLTIITKTSLSELHLEDNEITDRGAIELAQSLVDICQLQWLSLQGNKVTARGGEALAKYLPSSTAFDYI